MKDKVAVSLAGVHTHTHKVAVSLAGVHTHTHTHTLCLVNKKEKINKAEEYKQERNLLKK